MVGACERIKLMALYFSGRKSIYQCDFPSLEGDKVRPEEYAVIRCLGRSTDGAVITQESRCRIGGWAVGGHLNRVRKGVG